MRYALLLFFIVTVTHCTAIDKMKVLKAENPTINDPQTFERGMTAYKTHCTRCHGPSGLGDGPDAKGLAKKPTNLQIIGQNKSDGSIAANIMYGKGLMPAFKEVISEKEIWDIANYVKSWSKTDPAN